MIEKVDRKKGRRKPKTSDEKNQDHVAVIKKVFQLLSLYAGIAVSLSVSDEEMPKLFQTIGAEHFSSPRNYGRLLQGNTG